MLSACRHRNHLALVDVLGFDPCDVTVMVKDGKVTVSAEHEHECNTSMSKTYKYKKLVKEFDLPPGVCEDEVTCCLEPHCSIMKIETEPKSCPHLDF